eukprot:scaffold11716_cov101-Skeletonema_marinoi.AAC.3
MPPHVQLDHHDDLQEASSTLLHQCQFLNNNTNTGSEQSPLFQDDRSSRAAASPLDALRNNDDATLCDDSVAANPPVKKPEIKRITGIEAIIGSESRYAQNEIAVNNKSSSSSSSSTVATASSTSTSTTAPTSNTKGGKKVSKNNKVNSVLFPKDSMQRRKQIAGFFHKGKKIASSIVKKKKSKKDP